MEDGGGRSPVVRLRTPSRPVLYAIPDWMRSIGVDIRAVGLINLAQAPWSFKFLWSPIMDPFVPPFFGRRRGWAAIAQGALLLTTLALARLGTHPDTPWVVGALALAVAVASATQDIAVDAYAVDVLREDEQGVAVGARTALYRAAMFVAGGLSITLAGRSSWPTVLTGLRVSNLGTDTTTITVFAGPNQIDSYTLAAGTAKRKNYSQNTGPLQVVSDSQPILTTVRLLYSTNGYASYYEMMGLPNESSPPGISSPGTTTPP